MTAACAFALAACESTGVSSRIQEKSAIYSSLPPEQQAIIKKGQIEFGFTPDMTYMALGAPNSRQDQEVNGGQMQTWVYNKYYAQQGGLVANLNSPSQRYQSTVVSPSSPGHSKADAGPSLFSTTAGAQSSLDVPDMVPQRLTVYFVNGKVVDAEMRPEK